MEFELWKSKNGACYGGDFINQQGDLIAYKIVTLLDDLQKFPFLHLMKKEKIKKIESEIYEVRIRVKGNSYRFLFAIRENKGWILEAFIKKTEKTPTRNIENAKKRLSVLDNEIKK